MGRLPHPRRRATVQAARRRPRHRQRHPLASTLLGLADISFTGHHYQSRPDGKTTVIAEAEPATGQVSDEVLDAVADVAVLLPRP